MGILSRKDSKRLGLVRYFTGKPCINGHVGPRQTSNGSFLACCSEKSSIRNKRLSEGRLARADEQRIKSIPQELLVKVMGRDIARSKGLTQYFTGVPCVRGHISSRYVCNGTCVDCRSINYSSWYSNNPEKGAYYANLYRLRHPDRVKEYSVKYLTDNKERLASRKRDWVSRNKEHVVQYRKQYNRLNRAKMSAFTAMRKATLTQRTPAWSDRVKIEEIYALRTTISKNTGVLHHVDHIVPLRGRLVSGLHVHQNLRVIPAVENNQKYNRFDPMSDS